MALASFTPALNSLKILSSVITNTRKLSFTLLKAAKRSASAKKSGAEIIIRSAKSSACKSWLVIFSSISGFGKSVPLNTANFFNTSVLLVNCAILLLIVNNWFIGFVLFVISQIVISLGLTASILN